MPSSLRSSLERALPLTACLLGCSAPAGRAQPTDAGADDAATTATLTSLVVSTGFLRPPFDPAQAEYDITSLDGVYPIAVTATADASVAITTNGTPAQSGVASALTLQPLQDVTVVASQPGLASRTYTVHYVPSDLPGYTVATTGPAGTEDMLLTTGGTYLLLVDRAGRPLYYRTFLPDYVINFQQATPSDGTVRYLAHVGIYDPRGWTLGSEHVMDEHFGDLGDYQLVATAEHPAYPVEGHDLRWLGDEHYIGASYVERTLDLSSLNPTWSDHATVMSAVLQEVDHGQVLLEWDSATVPSLYADSEYENQFGDVGVSDYLHLNSIDVDPADDDLLLSFRHTSSIAKLDRHSGQIVWTLGGREDQFALTDEQTFHGQHTVRMQPDGSMVVFDNEFPTTAEPTRVLSFVLDQVNHRVTSFQVLYTKPAGQPQTTYMGSAVPLDGQRLLCGWGGWYVDSATPSVTEIVGGNTVWSFQFDDVWTFSYRAMPIPSLLGP